ncbi:MCE family protein [Mycobacterium terramassiliense]|uniref:MCE family protein n=1 Tax=Mycobacterium terramassiliense TaxID=1841859 RepID=UPI00248204B2|nr:MCE family protein [Mycobacterium terramassiliense]
MRALLGLLTTGAIVSVVVLAAQMFRGALTPTVAVTILSSRAGLVMNPEAKVKMLGVQVGRVTSIDDLPNGQAAIHLAMDPSQLHLIPANVLVDIASTTVFGAKYIQLRPPATPSPEAMHAGQVLDADHVTVEINTVFQQLSALLSKIEPAKLNATFSALSSALSGRGHKIGQMIADLDHFLATIQPSLPQLDHEFDAAPDVLNAYADAAPDLIRVFDNGTRISQTLIDEHDNLDAALLSVIGLADVGNDVVGTNRQPLTDLLGLLIPTTTLLNRYHISLNCVVAGMLPYVHNPPSPVPGLLGLGSILLGKERYRWPQDLPKVAATGGPHCADLGMPDVGFEKLPPYLIADIGTNPARYGNPGWLLNSDGLKQLLFGPIDGPPVACQGDGTSGLP